MLQTRQGIEEDLHGQPEVAKADIFLDGDVDSIDAVEKSLPSARILNPKGKTFYGSLEVWAKERSGKIIGFSQEI